MTDSMTAPLLAPSSTADARMRTANDGAAVPAEWHRGASPAAEATHTPPIALEQI
ncbi:conserved hypothetical protein [Xanthomonas citri pv. fuscans]|nr:conserved hypothetical protein [Xanthomonas citri pv. fuscans]